MSKVKMLFLYPTTALLLLMVSVSDVTAYYTCYSEDFGSASLNILNRLCNNKLPFNVERYDKFQDVFEKPTGSNSYFITPNTYAENGSCIETVPRIFVSNNSRLLIDYYTSSQNTLQYFNWIVEDADTEKNIFNVQIPIENRKWVVRHFLNMPLDANIKVKKAVFLFQCNNQSQKCI